MPLVTFEGVEGCGKSTQLELLAGYLRDLGRACRITREPGGTVVGEKIRAILMDAEHAELEPGTEWLLIEAARRQHVTEVIRPALAEGLIVLCDRFADSTEAYQVAGRGLDASWVTAVDDRVRGGIVPDLTLLYDIGVLEGLARARRRDAGGGRFESEDVAFHDRVRLRFLEIARREPHRVEVVRVDGDAAAVFEHTRRIVERRLGL